MEHTKKYLWLAAPYFITVGLLYLWAYWSSFGINVLEYATVSDVAKIAVIPVGSAFIFILIGFFIAQFAPSKNLFPPSGGKDTPTGRFLNKYRSFFLALYWLILLFLILTPFPSKWTVLPFWGMFASYLVLQNTTFLSEIRNDSVRSLIIASLAILPIFSFCQGKINAYKILTNSEYLYIKSSTQDEQMKYVGYINQLVFFISKDNQHIKIAKLDKESLDLLKFSKKDSEHNKVIQPTATGGS